MRLHGTSLDYRSNWHRRPQSNNREHIVLGLTNRAHRPRLVEVESKAVQLFSEKLTPDKSDSRTLRRVSDYPCRFRRSMQHASNRLIPQCLSRGNRSPGLQSTADNDHGGRGQNRATLPDLRDPDGQFSRSHTRFPKSAPGIQTRERHRPLLPYLLSQSVTSQNQI